ncbi:MAG: hypothetical protein AAB461_01745 [Patescibacteria group bacterium]
MEEKNADKNKKIENKNEIIAISLKSKDMFIFDQDKDTMERLAKESSYIRSFQYDTRQKQVPHSSR